MLFDFFKKKPPESPPDVAEAPAAAPPIPPTAEWDLSLLTDQISQLAPALETKEIEVSLMEARLADHYRDLQLDPTLPQSFEAITAGLDAEGWRRVALAVGVLDHAEIRAPLALLVAAVPQQVHVGFAQLARNTEALTLAMIRQSDVRAEEFARHFAAHLGVALRGETALQSRKRLMQIDYKRLLAEADEAKKQAEERMEYLRKKQDEDTARRRPRGKH